MYRVHQARGPEGESPVRYSGRESHWMFVDVYGRGAVSDQLDELVGSHQQL
jgi:hypothetical protein